MTLSVHSFGLIDALVVATFIVPPAVGMLQSVKASLWYMLYLIPCLISMSFYVCFIPGYATARLSELTWGTKDTGAGAAVVDEKKREYKRKARSTLFVVLLMNCLCFFFYVFVNDKYNVPGVVKVAGYIVLLLPMGLNAVVSLLFFALRAGQAMVQLCRRGCGPSHSHGDYSPLHAGAHSLYGTSADFSSVTRSSGPVSEGRFRHTPALHSGQWSGPRRAPFQPGAMSPFHEDGRASCVHSVPPHPHGWECRGCGSVATLDRYDVRVATPNRSRPYLGDSLSEHVGGHRSAAGSPLSQARTAPHRSPQRPSNPWQWRRHVHPDNTVGSWIPSGSSIAGSDDASIPGRQDHAQRERRPGHRHDPYDSKRNSPVLNGGEARGRGRTSRGGAGSRHRRDETTGGPDMDHSHSRSSARQRMDGDSEGQRAGTSDGVIRQD